MSDQDIKKILADVTIPEPDETARESAISAAMQEYAKQNALAGKKIKGKSKSHRLISTFLSKLTFFGESTMKRRYIWSGAITACLIVAIFGINQLYEGSKQMDHIDGQVLYEGRPSESTPIEAPPARLDAPVSPPSTAIVTEQSKTGPKEKTIEPQAVEEEMVMADMAAPEVIASPSASAPKTVPLKKAESNVYRKKAKTGVARTMDFPATLNQTMVKPEPVQEADELFIGQLPEEGRDRFEDVKVNPVKQVAKNPVSTFSVDVDTASYAFVRKMLNRGVLPQKNAVRVEELINYFDYDYALPKDKEKPFQPTVAVYPTPWNSNTKLLHIGIRGYDIEPDKKPDTNLVFLIDVSGSMNQPDKLPLLKNAFRMLVDNLQESDTVSIVVYAGAAGTALEPTKVKDKRKIVSALENLSAGGSTAGGEGIRQAYALAESSFVKNGVNRVILATDGDFNVGITNSDELKGFVERQRKTGIFLSVIGFGQGNYNDALMQKLAQNGNGNASYIDNLNEARKVLVEEANATLFTIAKDVKIQIEFNPAKVAEYRLIGYETRMLKREDFNNDQVDAGDIGSGHRVTAIYEIAEPGGKGILVDDLRYSKDKPAPTASNSENREYAFLKIRFKTPTANKSTLMTVPIDEKKEFKSLKSVPEEVRFAAAVAAYGQLLRQDPYTKTFSFDDVIKLALPARGEDPFGLRNEFINLVRLAKSAKGL
ncbi:MAG: VWA domain-containing protein [Proteobacteria bacterium]|nr:VWA domain-containing protein [Pseudomonadota bacterium]